MIINYSGRDDPSSKKMRIILIYFPALYLWEKRGYAASEK